MRMTNELVIIQNNQAVTSSLQVAENFEKQHKDVLESIRNLMAENSAVKNLFHEEEYTNNRGRKYPMYYMNRDGFTLLAMGFNGKKALDFKLKYIEQFNLMEEKLKSQVTIASYMIDDPIKRAEKWIEEQKEKMLLETKVKEQQKEIDYKEDVIIGLVDEVTLAEKRQILNQVVRMGGGNKTRDRWNVLYKQFESKYHINVNKRLERYNEENKPKLKNKLDYIDKVMNKIPELYEIACKLFENDIEKLVNELYELNNK